MSNLPACSTTTPVGTTRTRGGSSAKPASVRRRPNPYRYAGNDPINFYDPTGLTAQGNLLNNHTLNAYAGGYSGRRISNETLALRNFTNPISTVSLINSFSSPKNVDYTNFGPVAQTFNPLGTSTSTFRPSKVNVHDLLPTGPTLFDQVSSVVYAGLGGLNTGKKAVVNAGANSLSLGFYDGPYGVSNQDIYNGYNTSRLIAGGSSELFVGVATSGAARYAGAIGKTALAIDTTSNALNVGRGGVDAYNNGFNVGNTVQIIGGGLGLGGNIAAGGQALREIASEVGSYRLQFDAATFRRVD